MSKLFLAYLNRPLNSKTHMPVIAAVLVAATAIFSFGATAPVLLTAFCAALITAIAATNLLVPQKTAQQTAEQTTQQTNIKQNPKPDVKQSSTNSIQSSLQSENNPDEPEIRQDVSAKQKPTNKSKAKKAGAKPKAQNKARTQTKTASHSKSSPKPTHKASTSHVPAVIFSKQTKSNTSLEKIAEQITTLAGEEDTGNKLLGPLLKNKSDKTQATSIWLDDTIINNYIAAILDAKPKAGVVQISSLNDSKYSEKVLSERRVAEREYLQSGKTILWPVNDAEAKHWYLLIIQKQAGNRFTVSCLDGFNSISDHDKYFKQAETLITALYPQARIKNQSTLVPHQRNITDCGVVACYFAKKVVDDSLREFNSKKMPDNFRYTSFREQVARTIVERDQDLFYQACTNELNQRRNAAKVKHKP